MFAYLPRANDAAVLAPPRIDNEEIIIVHVA